MIPKVTILKNVPVLTMDQLASMTEEQLKRATQINPPLLPKGLSCPALSLFFAENSKGVHVFTGHYETKRAAVEAATFAKKAFGKPVYVYPVGTPKLNIETLPDEGPTPNSVAALTGPVQLGFPLPW